MKMYWRASLVRVMTVFPLQKRGLLLWKDLLLIQKSNMTGQTLTDADDTAAVNLSQWCAVSVGAFVYT